MKDENYQNMLMDSLLSSKDSAEKEHAFGIRFKSSEASRLGLYRKLVQGNVFKVINDILPYFSKFLEELSIQNGQKNLSSWVELFFIERAPQTHYLRDVASEFVSYLSWKKPSEIPEWLISCAEFESFNFDLSVGEQCQKEEERGSNELDVGLSLDCRIHPLMPLSARYFVAPFHLFDLSSIKTCSPSDTWLLGFRDTASHVHYLDLSSPLFFAWRDLIAGRSLGEVIFPLDEVTRLNLAWQISKFLDEHVIAFRR